MKNKEVKKQIGTTIMARNAGSAKEIAESVGMTAYA